MEKVRPEQPLTEPVSLSLKHPLTRGILSMQGGGGQPNFMTYLTGEWYAGTEWRDVRSPIDLGVVARIPKIPKPRVDQVLETAHKKGKWMVRDIPGEKRLEIYNRAAAILDENREDFADVLVKNAGKTLPAANGEVSASIERLKRSDLDTRRISGDLIPGDWSLETLETEAVVRREPLGVVLGVVPFNYPLFDAVNKIIYSTIAGNAILLKPASSTPLPVIMMAKAMDSAGFPKEGLAVLTVAGSEMKDVVSDRRIDCITLTGSSVTGVEVLRTAGIKQFVMELGGGDPAVVLNDAELNLTVQRITSGITSYAGQRCDAIKVILVEEGAYEGIKRGLVDAMGKIVVGDPREKTTTMGPLIDEETAMEVEASVKDAVAKGGKVLVGGHRLKRNYIEPTLIEMQKGRLGEAALYNSEVFAAISLITKVSSIDEAISLANGRRYGLDASVFGNDVNKIRKLTRLLEVGAIYINDAPRHGIGYYPFGGRKASGIGFEGIGYTLDYVMGHKSVIYNYKGKGVWEYM